MIANLCGRTEADIKALRQGYKITAAYKMVDTCAAEFAAATPYYYSVYGGPDTENEAVAAHDKKKGSCSWFWTDPYRTGYRI